MLNNQLEKEIGFHKGTINSLYLNEEDNNEFEIVTLDEDGIIKIHKMDGSAKQIDLTK